MTAIGSITGPQASGDTTGIYPYGKDNLPSVPSDHSSSPSTHDYVDSVQLSAAAQQVVGQQEAQHTAYQQHVNGDTLKAATGGQDESSATSSATTSQNSNSIPPSPEQIAEKIQEAKRQVQGLVGIDGVSEVVDGSGNIDSAKLAEIEAQQVTFS